MCGVRTRALWRPKMLVRLVFKQLDILQNIPKLEIVHDCWHRQPTANVAHPTQVLQGLMNRPPRPCPLANEGNQSRSQVLDGFAVKPPILPEEGRSSIAHQGGNRDGKHGCNIRVHLDVERGPWPLRVRLTKPEPPHPECPPEGLQVVNPQATELNWTASLFPRHRTVPAVHLTTSPRKAQRILSIARRSHLGTSRAISK